MTPEQMRSSLAELRANRDYAKADKLRTALARMNEGASYAFPFKYHA
jgi:hypothetical protein